ncbi:hypothetical protein HPP92_009232 [Vanilla planifolia]|uniref:Uncharacterized protein n=1 Tax=Vanilla planifolia TaxID=51239 RepID=A0A835RJH9_VANPL|nr:hypothetical protein HPP92_009232 [Vanilla planifolia]
MSKYGAAEAADVFYLEIEERIMLVISDEVEDDELPTRKMARAPPRSVYGNPQRLQQRTFLSGSWYGSFNLPAMRPGEDHHRKSEPWASRAVVGRRGTGVFIPQSAGYASRVFY